MSDLLDRIQKLQFTDKLAAEALLLEFARSTFPQLSIERLELRPLAVSLNSFNGYLYLHKGDKLFFKTHTEPDGVVGEYYRAEELAEVGYPILRPLMQSNEAGKQLLIYPYVDAPSVFDVAWQIEQGDISQIESLTAAQHDLDDQLFMLYERTLEWQSAEEAAHAPVHQLFYHRLAGGRLERFYGGSDGALRVADKDVEFRIVMNNPWVINNREYKTPLSNIINTATDILKPRLEGASIIGHGDAHNGNVFYHKRTENDTELSYFDPAFAGRHHPLLDLAKPLFHNVFCMWMYYPKEKAEKLDIYAELRGETLYVEHNYDIHPIRRMFLNSKIERVLTPTLKLLKQHGWLQDYWRTYLKAALFCCPLLTKNLLDPNTFPPQITLLGLSQAVEMGAESSTQRSLIDEVLDNVERTL
ncbi:MAG: hypothetical protein SF123_09990 [Chloroflexota bacterium]|nr:hypothetical protein [Chloroflexota bacterium]